MMELQPQQLTIARADRGSTININTAPPQWMIEHIAQLNARIAQLVAINEQLTNALLQYQINNTDERG